MRILKYISIILLIFGAAGLLRTASAPYHVYRGEIFGTYYKIKAQNNELEKKIKEKLEDINTHMSVFDPNSEISRLNRTKAKQKFMLSPQMSDLLRTAKEINTQTGGWFDPAIGSLVELWGFGTDKNNRRPASEKIKETLEFSNFDLLKFSPDFKTVIKKDSRTFLNLSAIAKGYGVDEIARLLEENGSHDYIVEIGGEVRVGGQGPNGLWNIGLTKPSENESMPAMTIAMTDYAVATSGDYRNYYYQNGRRYSHTISPHSGYPVENTLASATVFHPECVKADAYATALMAMGRQEAESFAVKQRLAVILYPHDGDIWISPAARDLIGE